LGGGAEAGRGIVGLDEGITNALLNARLLNMGLLFSACGHIIDEHVEHNSNIHGHKLSM
jgi:hypothetical protein